MLFLFSPLLLFAVILSIASAAPSCGLVPPKQPVLDAQSSSSFSGNDTSKVLLAAWYPGWLSKSSPPSNISWEKYNTLTFAFATTTPDVNKLFLDPDSQEALSEFVALAKSNNVTALVSIGGWTGSQYFSNHVATEENRSAFVKTVINLINQYDLDGLSSSFFSWEYPNDQGVGCNAISPNDSPNFLLFLEALRKEIGTKVISAAVRTKPFLGPNNQPMTDVSAFATVLDHIVIMVYDAWGSWSATVGPNAPLKACEGQESADAAASAAVEAWTTAKFPVQKIALGVAGYGHSFHVDSSQAFNASGALNPYAPFDASQQPHGDSQDGDAGEDQCGKPVGIGGVFNFWGLVLGGFLNTDGTPADGIDYVFDECSQTPFVYNRTSQVIVSFDDAKSFAAKGEFIDNKDLYGFSMWHSAGDYDNILVDSITESMHLVQDCSSS
ncbi:Chitinase A1 [Hypsizygus marmoreus]|uniref:Chitinase A1 n=1 Tax=Hypsizygus marmoreus TaxID=39966 RepID=A0A369K4H0_HYPMA|nr:Chitinase A1 [Hypsizygus marmoreus]